jgi:malate/lactate dehydrogenase-like protein
VTKPDQQQVSARQYRRTCAIGSRRLLFSRVHLAERFAVSPACIEANVVGEHGTSSVFLWSSARIGGMGVADALAKRGSGFDAFRHEVEQDVRYANIMIIEGLGASQYGVGMVAARVAEVVLRDERAVFPVGAHNARYGVALSLPSVVGRQGVVETFLPEMSDDETRALERSAETCAAQWEIPAQELSRIALVQDSIFDRDLSFALRSSDAVGYWHTEGGHDVEDFAADLGLGLLSRQSPVAQGPPDYNFIA